MRPFVEIGRSAAARVSPPSVAAPEGAFYLFPDFRPFRRALRVQGIRSSLALGERLLQDTGVATIPGSSCGRHPSELTLRMAYVDFDGTHVLDNT